MNVKLILKALGFQPTEGTRGLQIGNFPAEITSEATFRCVKVSSIDDAIDRTTLAYKTSISVGGHIFKGILYYQGCESNSNNNVGESSSSEPPPPPQHQQQPYYPFTVAALTTTTAATTTTTTALAAADETPYSSSFTYPFGSYVSAAFVKKENAANDAHLKSIRRQ
ncbi:protein SHI RELATED SEQUENCE 1 [Citrus sinensis]|nr:protein SHI RELATED SEQUENCE 1 [Citrus sinensis]